VVIPLAKPAIAVTALFSFMTAWNEFIIAATFMDKELDYTAPVGLRFFVGGFSQSWGYFAAGSVIVSIPVVFLFLYLQKYLVSRPHGRQRQGLGVRPARSRKEDSHHVQGDAPDRRGRVRGPRARRLRVRPGGVFQGPEPATTSGRAATSTRRTPSTRRARST